MERRNGLYWPEMTFSFIWVKCESPGSGVCRTRGTGCIVVWSFVGLCVCVCEKKKKWVILQTAKKKLSGYTERAKRRLWGGIVLRRFFFSTLQNQLGNTRKHQNGAERLICRRSRTRLRQINPHAQTEKPAKRRKTPKTSDFFGVLMLSHWKKSGLKVPHFTHFQSPFQSTVQWSSFVRLILKKKTL